MSEMDERGQLHGDGWQLDLWWLGDHFGCIQMLNYDSVHLKLI